MQGHQQGVTSYSVDQSKTQPSYGYTTETTEFDDALIQRGIVSRQQALVAKGATPAQAQALLQQEHEARQQWKEQQQALPHWNADHDKKDSDDDNDDDDSFLDDDDDDEFMQQYRAKRMQEMKQQQSGKRGPRFGEVLPITRPEWQRHVNEASHNAWVVVLVVSTDTERTGCAQRAIQTLAPMHPDTKFVTIPAAQAVADRAFPTELLPTLFCYRDGRMQHQISPPHVSANVTSQALQELLRKLGVLLPITQEEA